MLAHAAVGPSTGSFEQEGGECNALDCERECETGVRNRT
jgi:hypothetical protein